MKTIVYRGPHARLRTDSGRVAPRDVPTQVTDDDVRVARQAGKNIEIKPEADDGEGSDTENKE